MDENMAYSAPEVAYFLKVSVYTIVRKLKSGEIKGKKVGARWVILGSNVMEYLRDTEK